jgi:hypothetical protein
MFADVGRACARVHKGYVSVCVSEYAHVRACVVVCRNVECGGTCE